MANPNNAIGTNGAFGGRTSVNALNDVLATFNGRGVLSGWAITPSTGMTVQVGGQSGLRDVAIAEDNNGNRTTVDNISQAPVLVDIASAPSTNSRMDAIVGYVENPPQGSATVLDNPAACGIVAVSGTASNSPSAPTESTIRTALTNEGINGATAYYVVLGTVTIPSGTTDIDVTMINKPGYAQLSADKVDFATMPIYSKSNASAVSLSSSDVKIAEITVGSAGNYVALGFMQSSGNGGGANLSLQLRRNGTIYGPRLQYNWDLGQNTWGIFANIQRVIPLSAGDTVALWGGNSRNQQTEANASNLTLIKVSN